MPCCTPSSGRPTSTAAPAAVTSAPDHATHATLIDLPGGTFLMGSDHADAYPQDGESPVREVTVAPFAIDRYPVTNRLFHQFIEATNYRTEAEVFGWSFVFHRHVSPHLVEDTVAAAPWWCKVRCSTWNNPDGPGSDIAQRLDHPVTQVSWNDAQAYAAWAGLRLPTEAEWEYAARGGLVQKLYPWGDDLRPNGQHLCNIWQGDFPNHDTAEDGYSGTSPVDAYPPNAFGLYSMTGNTWEWTATSATPTAESRIMKGGSFLCHESYCNRYRVAARTANTPDSATTNIGFRVAR